MNSNIKILRNYILYFLTFLLICIVGISNVFGITIDNYSTKYYWGTADSTSITETGYRTGSENKLTLFPGSAPTYSDSETFNGFYNQINYAITKGSIYTLSFNISYSNLFESEWGSNNVNNRLLSTDFAHCSNCTITAVSGSIRRYNASAPLANNLYDYVVSISYTFVATSDASTWYIGSYTGDDRTMGVYQHQYTSVIFITGLNISNDNSSTLINQNDTIINQNEQIIQQNQQNTQEIINNQNQNTEDMINSQKVCNSQILKPHFYNVNLWESGGKYVYSDSRSGAYIDVSSFVGKKINITFKDMTNIFNDTENIRNNYCFASSEATSVASNCISYNILNQYRNGTVFNDILVPNNAKYLYLFGYLSNGTSNDWIDYVYIQTEEICKNGNQAVSDSVNDLNDSLNDDDSSGASSEASEFFSSFTTNTFGLTSIITAPLNLIQSLTSSTCSELHLPLPYLNNKYLDLPCMTSIYQTHFGSFFTMYQTITYGIIAYWVIVRIFNQVKDFKNPEHDEIEVVDL